METETCACGLAGFGYVECVEVQDFRTVGTGEAVLFPMSRLDAGRSLGWHLAV